MTLDPKIFNDGSRPSLLELGRRASGEVDGVVDPVTQAAFEEARGAVKPLDMVVLRARAVRIAEEEARSPVVAAEAAPGWTERLRSWWFMGALLPVLAAALVFVRPPSLDPAGDTGVRDKGRAELPTGPAQTAPVHLDYLLLQGDEVLTVGDAPLALPGDRIQFRYEAGGLDRLVLLSIDGSGTLSVFWPEQGDRPEAVQPKGEQLLEGSVILDDAPGPEAFVAVFGTADVRAAEQLAQDAWVRGGLDGLQGLADDLDHVDLVVVERAP